MRWADSSPFWWLLVVADELLFSTEDARVLLGKLEEVCTRSAQGGGADYLGVLARTMKNDVRLAAQRMQVVRLALAKYYARCGVIGVGGRIGSGAVY